MTGGESTTYPLVQIEFFFQSFTSISAMPHIRYWGRGEGGGGRGEGGGGRRGGEVDQIVR